MAPTDVDGRVRRRREPASTPVRRVRKAYEQVADQLRELIVRGELRPGDRLPVESALARDFGVSRATVREALRLLTAQSLVRTEKGAAGGSYVTLPTAATISSLVHANVGLLTAETRTVTLEELLEARELVEGAGGGSPPGGPGAEASSGCAVVPGDAVDLSTLEEFAHNAEFHSCLLGASHNTLLVVSAQPIFSVLQTHLARSALGGRFHRSIHEHHHRMPGGGRGRRRPRRCRDARAPRLPAALLREGVEASGRHDRAALTTRASPSGARLSGSPDCRRSLRPCPSACARRRAGEWGRRRPPARSASSRTAAIHRILSASYAAATARSGSRPLRSAARAISRSVAMSSPSQKNAS